MKNKPKSNKETKEAEAKTEMKTSASNTKNAQTERSGKTDLYQRYGVRKRSSNKSAGWMPWH